MQKAADDNGVILNIGVCNRFNTAVNKMRRADSAAGELGEPVSRVLLLPRAPLHSLAWAAHSPPRRAAGGGALIDWGVHYLRLDPLSAWAIRPMQNSFRRSV